MSTGTTISTQGGTQSGVNSPGRVNRDPDNWKRNMENALSAWKQSMYGHNTGSLNTLNFNRASLTLYRIASLTLYASIVELQVVAGIPKIMGRPIPEYEQKRILKKMCTTWIQS